MVLRQEDGAVRPEKRKVLDTQQRVIVGDIKASPVVKKKLAVEKKTELSAQRKRYKKIALEEGKTPVP